MLIRDDDDRPCLLTFMTHQLESIANRTDVARVRMEKILRPMLCLNAIVTERPYNFELHRPLLRHQDIWHASRSDSGISVAVMIREMLRDELRELRFTVRPCAQLELLEGDAAAVYGADGLCRLAIG